MLTRLREGTPDAAREGRADARHRGFERAHRSGSRASPTPSASCARSSGSTSRPSPARSSGSSAHRGAARPPCSSSSPACDRRTRGRSRSAGATEAAERLERCAYMPQRDLLLPWLSAARQRRRWRCGSPVSRAAEARARAGEHFERLGLSGFEAVAPGRALRRHAPAGRLPAHADGGPARPAARRALRLARRDHPGGDAVLARRSARARTSTRSCSSPTTSRRRSISPTACWCSARVRRASPTGSRSRSPRAADRAAAVTSAEFAELKERALRSLAEAAR